MGCQAKGAWHERARSILEALGVSPRSVLDFGAGEGHLVGALRDMGLAAEGIETSPSGRAAAQEMYNLELRDDVSADLHGQFQLVTLIHSLEHVANPVRVLTTLAAALEPGGLLFVEVPHAGSFDMWWPRRRREILDLPVHLYHFVPQTLVRVAERAGFHVVEIRLSNPDILERALKVREHRNKIGRTGGSTTTGAGTGHALTKAKSSGFRSLWATRVLPWIRLNFPGGKIQLLATRPY